MQPFWGSYLLQKILENLKLSIIHFLENPNGICGHFKAEFLGPFRKKLNIPNFQIFINNHRTR